jgi:hypothetical protein
MPKFSSKHKGREQVFKFDSFQGGYTEEIAPAFLSTNQLSECQNMKYVLSENDAGEKKVTIKNRQGTTIISNTAIATDVLACTYFIGSSKYILATATKLYYLDSSDDPVEIGTNLLDGVPTFTEFNSKLIIHDSGITKFWDGTTSPVLDTNYGKIDKTFIDEILATGDNTETEYTGTLTNVPMTVASLVVTFTDTTTKTITEDATGRLEGDVVGETSGWFETVDGTADNTVVQITLNGHGFSNGDEVNVAGVVGTTEANSTAANPTWTVANKQANSIDLVGSVYANAYTSGGTVSLSAVSNHTTGAYMFKCSGAPDNQTTVLATYDEKDGAPKSKAGLVRGSRLYTWGDGDNTSRLTYTEVGDEKATDTSSGGGYLDIDPNDGYTLLGALNFETSLLLLKQNSLHRSDSYPDDADFRVEKLTDDLGAVAHRTPLFEGDIVSFVGKEGWVAMSPSQRYGDIQKGVPISRNFRTRMARYSNATAYAAYNPIDKQLWLSLSTNGSTTYLSDIYVSNLETGGQISKYNFKFSHTCFEYVNGWMLIGGADGNLYKLDDTNTVFSDNAVSYSDETFVRSGFVDWGTSEYTKHNKRIFLDVAGSGGTSFTFDVYKDNTFDSILKLSVSSGSSWTPIYDYQTIAINGETGAIGQNIQDIEYRKKFNYKTLMVRFSDMAGTYGTEILGASFKSALIGDR